MIFFDFICLVFQNVAEIISKEFFFGEKTMSEDPKKRIKTAKTDGEEITFFEPEQIAAGENWDLKKKAAKNPFSKLGLARISTQGPER